MTDSSDKSPPTAPPTGGSMPGASPPTPRRTRRWKRRFVIGAMIVLILFVLFRISIYFTLPPVLNRVAGAFGLTATYERLDLSLLSGDAGLWNFKLTPKAGGAPLIDADYVRGNISTLKLLTGKLHVWRAEADGVNVTIERDAEGNIPVLTQLIAAFTSEPPAASPASQPAPADSPLPIDFAPPLRVDAFRLQSIRLHLKDRSISPPLDTLVGINVRVSNIGNPDRTTDFDVEVFADPVIDSFRIRGSATTAQRQLTGDATVALRGLKLGPLAGYLQQAGLTPYARSIDANLKGSLTINANDMPAGAIRAQLRTTDVNLLVDGVENARLDAFQVDIAHADAKSLRVRQVAIQSPAIQAARASSGRIRVLGVELGAEPLAQRAVAPTSQAEPRRASLPALDIDFPLTIDAITVTNARAAFSDDTISPPVGLTAVVPEASVLAVSLRQSDAESPSQLAARFQLPGVAQEGSVSGTWTPFATRKSLDASLKVTGIRPDALKPYLDAINVRSTLNDGTLTARLSAHATVAQDSLTAGLHIRDVLFTDAARELLRLEKFEVDRLVLDVAKNSLDVGLIDIVGPVVPATLDPEHGAAAMGFQTTGIRIPTAQIVPDSGTQSSTLVLPREFPRLHLKSLRWSGAQVGLDDQNTRTQLSIADARLEIDDFLVDLQRTTPAPPGRIEFRMRATNLAEDVHVTGTLTARRGGVDTALQLKADKINIATLKPYLAPLGIEPLITSGAGRASVSASLSRVSDSLDFSLDARDLRLTDGDNSLADVERVLIKDIAVREKSLSLGDISITRPRFAIARNEAGDVESLGLRLLLLPARNQPTSAGDRIARGAPEAPANLLPSLPIAVLVPSIHVSGAELSLTDRAVAPAVETVLRGDFKLVGMVAGSGAMPDSEPGNFSGTLKLDGVIDQLEASGFITYSPGGAELKVAAKGSGLRVGPLLSYLPPELDVAMSAATLETAATVRAKNLADGGLSFDLELGRTSLMDGERVLAALDRVNVSLPRVSQTGDRFEIAEIVAAGVESGARRTESGDLEISLLRYRSQARSVPAQPARTDEPAAVQAQSTQPASIDEGDVASRVASARQALPHITVERLDLGLKRFVIADESRPQSKPLVLRDAQLRNVAPVDLGGADGPFKPPSRFELVATIEPAIQSATIQIATAPLAQQPTLTMDIDLAGIRGAALTELLPELRSVIDGIELVEGRFRTRIEATARIQRRGPVQFDLSRPFELDLLASGIEFRTAPDTPVSAGVAEIRADGIRINPRTSVVQFRSLDITQPSLHVRRDHAGFHVGGITGKVLADEAAKSGAPAASAPNASHDVSPAAASDSKPAPESGVARTAPPAGDAPPGDAGASAPELRIDRLQISGVDFTLKDETVKPAAILPITSLEMDVSGISTLAFSQFKPVRFNVLVGAGAIELAKRTRGGGIPGAIGDFAKLLGGEKIDSAIELEKRDMFSQVVASGTVGLHPRLSGSIKASVSGFELGALTGIAKSAGVDLAGGIFDFDSDIRFQENNLVVTRNRIILTDLQIKEPDNGPISRQLRLPGGLDAAIQLLQDPGGSITLRVPVRLKDGELNRGQITSAAIGGVSEVILTAIASAPVKIVQGVSGLVGLGGLTEHKPSAELPPSVLTFSAGDTRPSPEMLRSLESVRTRLSSDARLQVTIRHRLSGKDVLIAESRGNPSAEDARGLAMQLRSRVASLREQRGTLAAQARVQLTLTGNSASPARERLRAIDREIAVAERSLDDVYELLKPGAERLGSRRTRLAALAIATDRVDYVRSYLVSGGVAAERIQAPSPRFEVIEDESQPADITITFATVK